MSESIKALKELIAPGIIAWSILENQAEAAKSVADVVLRYQLPFGFNEDTNFSQCDEAEPGCSYCLKKNITCPGYKSQFDIAWRDQNVVAERSVQRRKNANENASQHSVVEQILHPDVPRALPQDYEEYATKFFFWSYIFVRKDLDVERNFLDCLHPVWMRSHPKSPLRPAVIAVASCMLEVWSQLRPDVPLSLSRSQYLKGIEVLRKRLQSNQEVDDDLLMASLMLEMYENISAFCTSRQNKGLHASGTMALIRQRSYVSLPSQTSQQVLLGARNHVMTTAMRRAERVPLETSAMTNLTPDIPKTAGYWANELNVELINLSASVSQNLQSEITPQEVTSDILRQAVNLDQRFLAWRSTIPPDWEPITLVGTASTPPSVRNGGLYEDRCDVHKNIFVANTLNMHCISRIKIQSIILACLSRIETSDSDSITTTRYIIQEQASNVCASIPFYLGDRMEVARIDDKAVQYPTADGSPASGDHIAAAAALGGFFVVARLSELMSYSTYLSVEQRRWIGGQLSRVAKIYVIQAEKSE